ncbi:MAG: hypothetical protein JKY65_31945 [Planctomycetes bacterium]|nr:hypothetical protein [Planctomycetota bacterium]
MRRLLAGGIVLLLVGVPCALLFRPSGSGSPPTPTPSLPPLLPRGEVQRGVEVFAPGFRSGAEVVQLCYGVHSGVGRLLGGQSSPVGLRLHLFSRPDEGEQYVARALGRHQRGTSYIRLNQERLVVLEPASSWALLQHELAHDATCEILGDSVPGFFAEGLAVNFEAWRIAGGRASPRPSAHWATRFLELAERGEVPSQAVLGSAPRFSGGGAYARSWGTFASLLFLARWTRRVSPTDLPASDVLDELGQVLASHWGASPARSDALLERARVATGQERRLLLALAEQVEARWADPSAAGVTRRSEFAEAVRELGEPSSAWQAGVHLVGRRGEARDLADLARLAQARGWSRLARAAALLRLRQGPSPAATSLLEGLPKASASRVRARATQGRCRVLLRSATWDPRPLKSLARRVARALWRAEQAGHFLAKLTLDVEAPGPQKRDLTGWPDDSQLRTALVAQLLNRLPSRPSLRWKSLGLAEAMACEIDPGRALRSRAELRGARAGFPSFEWETEAHTFGPLSRTEAADRLLAGREFGDLAPLDLLSLDPGDPRVVEAFLSRLKGEERLFFLLRALLLGSPSPKVLPALIKALEEGGFLKTAAQIRSVAIH